MGFDTVGGKQSAGLQVVVAEVEFWDLLNVFVECVDRALEGINGQIS